MNRATLSAPLPDAGDRRSAATSFDRNLVVTAGAGTGKTALLVERALNLIAGLGHPVSTIAAITFTEKAAAELRRRLATGLDDLRALARDGTSSDAADPATEAGRSYAWLIGEAGRSPDLVAARALDALLDLDAAPVSTIHSFCAEILRRHPRESNVDPDLRIDEGPAFDQIFAEEWDRFLLTELSTAPERAAVWRRALAVSGALEAVRAIARSLSSFVFPGEALLPDTAYLPATPAIFGREIDSVREAIADLLGRARQMNPNMHSFLESSAAFLAAFRDRGPEEMARAGAPIALQEYIDKGLPLPGKKLSGASPEEVTRAAREASRIIKALSRVDEGTIAALTEAAMPLAHRCREKLLASGYASFDALLRLTRDLLARHPEIRRAQSARYRTLLVDEFQDTDPLQYEILFFIAEAEGAAAADAYRAALAPGKLFIVGDPKQSIYRFRGADIEAYQRAVDHVLECGGARLSLSASFRSPDEVVGPINRLFSNWMGHPNGGGEGYEPPYVPIISARGAVAKDAARVEIWSIDVDGNAAARRSAEGTAIASFIERHDGSGPQGAPERDYRRFAILLRALTHAGIYAQALRRAGIPFIVEGGKDFYERPEVGDLISFLRAAANSNDAASVLAVLRGPLGAVPDAELARFATAGGRLDRPDGGLADLQPFPNVRCALALLDTFRSGMAGRPPDDVIRAALTETPLALLHAALFEGAQRLANLGKLVLRAGALARRGMSLEETLRSIEDEFEGERAEGESPLADETVNAVRLLSVHKAKGLEFPVVFVPDVGRGTGGSSDPAPRTAWIDRQGGRVAACLQNGACNLAWVFHSEAARRHEAAEEKRVFYVACTRAKDQLILINSNPEKKAPWRDALTALGYGVDGGFPPEGLLSAGVRHARVTPEHREAPVPPGREDPIWAEAALAFAAASAAARDATAPPIQWPAGIGEERMAASDTDRPPAPPRPGRAGGAGRAVARAAGVAVHAALHRWDLLRPQRLRELGRAEARRAAADAAGGGSPEASLTSQVTAEVSGIIEGFLASPLPARLASVEILGREVPVLYRDGAGVTWIGVCDLLYRDAGGTIVVADYKTDHSDGDRAGAAERYRGQVGVYVEAVRRAFPGRSVRAEILFVREGAGVALSP